MNQWLLPLKEVLWPLLTLGWRELWLCPMGMLVGVGDDTEPVLPRSTASQMQRGSGELQSTPTGFWKLQSDPAAGHGSIAAGIGAWGLLRSTSLTAHMGCTHTQRSWTKSRCRNTDNQARRRRGGFSGASQSSSPGSNPSLSKKFNPTSSTSQPLAPVLRKSASLTHIQTLWESRGSRRQTPGQQMEECVWHRDQR